MGFNTIFDIIGSIFIAGSLLIIVLNLQGDISQMTYTYGSDLIVQSNMTTITRMLESDFRRIGYWSNVDSTFDPTTAVRAAGPHNITFLADVDGQGSLDTIKYWIGTTNDLTNTPNPNDVPLYRKVNSNSPVLYNIGVTRFDFSFFTSTNNGAPQPPGGMDFPISIDAQGKSGIFFIQLEIMLQSRDAYDSLYTYSYWKQLRLESVNLMNR